jgi:hypothetical protein
MKSHGGLLPRRELIKRLEVLETRFVPATSEPPLIHVSYVDGNGNVVEIMAYDMRPPRARSREVPARTRQSQISADECR